MELLSIGLLSLVALLWGVTNPLLRSASSGLNNNKSTSITGQVGSDLWYLLTNISYWLVFGINQLGSLLFYWTLGRVSISSAVPLANAGTLVVTLLTEECIGTRINRLYSYVGVVFVGIGIYLCVL
ncbi:putative membrane protein [Oopsacas minuta]|uniref:Membrane protein n=1 Tax=Oopsacas minuta TaxID=111878 RepID=A0AAV7K362_9METZ|nr:putative membrane protein [Oopsacas minuta]